MPRPTYANVVSTLALFVALGGVSWAAIKLPKNSVGAKQIRKAAVRSSDVKDGALKAKDLAAGVLTAGPKGDKGDKGEKGDPGAQGPTGPAGSARAHARIKALATPTIVAGTGKNVVSVTRGGSPSNHVYCIDLAFDDPKTIVATAALFDTIAGASVSPDDVESTIPGICPAGTDALVGTAAGDGTPETGRDFYFLVE